MDIQDGKYYTDGDVFCLAKKSISSFSHLYGSGIRKSSRMQASNNSFMIETTNILRLCTLGEINWVNSCNESQKYLPYKEEIYHEIY